MTKFTRKFEYIAIISCTTLLLGCNFQQDSTNYQQQLNQTNQQLYTANLSTVDTANPNALTIHTVEFSSDRNVKNVSVALLDFETGKTLASTMVNDQGQASFDMVEADQPYEVVIYKVEHTGELSEQTREFVVFDPDHPIVKIETFNAATEKSLAVPIVKQNPELPNGCEITALTAILNYFGIDVDKMELTKNYLPTAPITNKGGQLYGPNPNKAYAGDPTQKDGGYYVFAEPIVDVANQVLFEKNSHYKALNLSDVSREEILAYVNSGVPVITWITIDLKKPRTFGYWIIEETKEKHPIFMNLHAVVLTGYKDGKVTIMNPLTGNETIDDQVFFDSFKSLGSHAVVIL
nr:C39 family peptidase [Lysinibacillus timonensis]